MAIVGTRSAAANGKRKTRGRLTSRQPYALKRQSPVVVRGQRGITSTLLFPEPDSLRLLCSHHEFPTGGPIVEALNLTLDPVATPDHLTPDVLATSGRALASASAARATSSAAAAVAFLGVTVMCASGCHLTFGAAMAARVFRGNGQLEVG
jgi:hypothetical protein